MKKNTKGKAPQTVLKGEDFRPSESEINPVGRPTDYSPELVGKILSRVSCGESLRSICRDDDMPDNKTVWMWKLKYPEFSNQYLRAREDGCEGIADHLLDIADGDEPDRPDEDVQRSRLRVDTRKWYLSKIKKQTYGDKLETTIVDPYKDMTREEILNELEERRAKRLKESEA